MLVRGDDYIPTGEISQVPNGPWDDAFTGMRSDPVIRWGKSAELRISSDVPWWVIYTEDPLAICVEPQTAPPDAANLGIIGSHSISATFTFSSEGER
jgi:aldose 1-epimerase